mmetsp:Transcript_10620/g.48792  ORF Transcript_10620/g.48792 Transcript_10620/m.48792 type:complete len:316 (-) Transcript_10620:283-1230(-)
MSSRFQLNKTKAVIVGVSLTAVSLAAVLVLRDGLTSGPVSISAQNANYVRSSTTAASDVSKRVWNRKQVKHAEYAGARAQMISGMDWSRVHQLSAYDAFEPEWNCEDEARIGAGVVNTGDGPKFACGSEVLSSTQNCIVYSIGSNLDFSFEYAVHKIAPNCTIHTFDGTVNLTKRALPNGLKEKNIQFHNWNIVSDCHTEHSTISVCVHGTLKKLNHELKTISWLKIDCEGCEHTVIPHFLESSVHIDQIMVEMHGTDALKTAELFKTLHNAGMMIFHKERNQWGCQGYNCVEYSLISADLAKKVVQNVLGAWDL